MESRELVRLLSESSAVINQQKRQYLVDFGQCRTAAKGGQMLHCEHCGLSAVVYNPCNRRGCPVCGLKNQIKWLNSAKERFLPTGHIHLVFSFPDDMTRRWQKEPRETVSFVFKAVNRVMKRLERELGLTLGRVLVFQSHAKGLSYKAHVHCLITAGGLDNQDRWKSIVVLPLVAMTKWIAPMLEPEGIRIHQTRHEKSGDRFLEYLGFRQFGLVVKANQISQSESKITVREFRGNTQLGTETFVQRYIDHIPEKGCVMVRHYGLYSNRQRPRYASAVLQLVPEPVEDKDEGPYQYCCPKCKVPMSLKATWRPGGAVNYSQCGFQNHPPDHWEVAYA